MATAPERATVEAILVGVSNEAILAVARITLDRDIFCGNWSFFICGLRHLLIGLILLLNVSVKGLLNRIRNDTDAEEFNKRAKYFLLNG